MSRGYIITPVDPTRHSRELSSLFALFELQLRN
jgi:hypothetical protein